MRRKPPRPTLEEQRARVAVEEAAELAWFTAPPTPVEAPPPPTPTYALVSRLVNGNRQAVMGGSKGSGPAPYGYCRSGPRGSLQVVAHEAAVVQRIFDLYLERNGTVARVVDTLNFDGVRTRRGRLWSRAGVAWILRNRTYVGFVAWGSVRARGKHQSIVAPIRFNLAGAQMRKNNRRRQARKVEAAS